MRLDTTNDLAVLAAAGTIPAYSLSTPTGTSKALPALTGLRFVAAFFVVMGHTVVAFVTFAPEPHLFVLTVSALVSIGMSLLFVLSGFVIHYNYSGLLRTLNSRAVNSYRYHDQQCHREQKPDRRVGTTDGLNCRVLPRHTPAKPTVRKAAP